MNAIIDRFHTCSFGVKTGDPGGVCDCAGKILEVGSMDLYCSFGDCVEIGLGLRLERDSVDFSGTMNGRPYRKESVTLPRTILELSIKGDGYYM